MKDKKSIYIETTIPSYLTAWLSSELVMAANQQSTRIWWTDYKDKFELFVSEIVIQEAGSGNLEAAKRRLEVLNNISKLDISIEAENLAIKLLNNAALPAKAATDALHIAIATVHGIDFLLTWNCRHIANATLRSKIETICRVSGYEPPIICTPQELIGG